MQGGPSPRPLVSSPSNRKAPPMVGKPPIQKSTLSTPQVNPLPSNHQKHAQVGNSRHPHNNTDPQPALVDSHALPTSKKPLPLDHFRRPPEGTTSSNLPASTSASLGSAFPAAASLQKKTLSTSSAASGCAYADVCWHMLTYADVCGFRLCERCCFSSIRLACVYYEYVSEIGSRRPQPPLCVPPAPLSRHTRRQ